MSNVHPLPNQVHKHGLAAYVNLLADYEKLLALIRMIASDNNQGLDWNLEAKEWLKLIGE